MQATATLRSLALGITQPPQPQPITDVSLAARAAKHYPDSPYLQAEYIRAVGVVRSTKGGWVMDQRPLPPVPDRYRQ